MHKIYAKQAKNTELYGRVLGPKCRCSHNAHSQTMKAWALSYVADQFNTKLLTHSGFFLMETEDLVSVETSSLLTDVHEVLHERATVSTVIGCTVDRSLSLMVPARRV